MFEKVKKLNGINLITLSTSVRFFGWGLGEVLIPIFLLMFSTSFLETGILASIYSVTFLISIPIAGHLADNIKIKKMILVGLVLYIFTGLGYFFAGVTGAVIFIILARGLNGIAYSLDQVGREFYIIKHSNKGDISKAFGKFDVITMFWWMFAVAIGLLLVKFMSVPIYWLLFFVIPTSIISFLIVLKLNEREKKYKEKVFLLKAYSNLLKDMYKFDIGLKVLLLLTFVTGILSSIIYFFVPISVYVNGGSLIDAGLLALVYTIPILFGRLLGKIADNKKGGVYPMSFFLIIIILVSLIFAKSYIILSILMFVSSAIFELISLTNRGVLARFADRTHLGEIDSSLNGVSALGTIVGPPLFGFLLDSSGKTNSYMVIVFISVVALIISFFGVKKLSK